MACIIDDLKKVIKSVMNDKATPYLENLDTLKKNLQASKVVEVKGYDPENKDNLLSVYHSPKDWKQFTYDNKKFSSIEGAYKYALVKKAKGVEAGNKFYSAEATSKNGKTYRKNEGYTARSSAGMVLREETISDQYKLDEMEKILTAYFTTNEDAKQMLLDTGNSTIKHKQGQKDTSPQIYNKVIGKVRDKLRDDYIKQNATKGTTFNQKAEDIKNKIC